jgi:DNA-binding response OmpR family regulator
VLIVEDDNAARRAITLILKRQGFAVSEARTVADAMHGLDRARPDWILLDLMLPDGDGISVLHRIRADRLASKVCIITGCGSDQLIEARRAGAEHIFIKPLNVESLMTLLTA